MKVIRDYLNASMERPVSAAAGFFDGFHRGHQKVAEKAVEDALRLNCFACAVTFEDSEEQLLTTSDEKIELLENAGFEAAVILKYGGEWMRWTPGEFIENFLLKTLNVRSISVGSDFRFGRDRQGGTETLKASGRIEVHAEELMLYGNEKISSTAIKHSLRQGNLDEAALMLGRNYFFTGRTVSGSGKGKEIGFPTVNFDVSPGKLLPEGVFACELVFDSLTDSSGVFGACFIGDISVAGLEHRKRAVEVHVFGYEESMRERIRGARILKKIRDTMSFKSVGGLSDRIASDTEKIKVDIKNSTGKIL